MIPSPDINTVFQFFRNDPQPIKLEQIKKNYGDHGLAHVYLPSLIEDGFILADERGYRMSETAINAGIADAEEKIAGWKKRLEYLNSLKA